MQISAVQNAVIPEKGMCNLLFDEKGQSHEDGEQRE